MFIFEHPEAPISLSKTDHTTFTSFYHMYIGLEVSKWGIMKL